MNGAPLLIWPLLRPSSRICAPPAGVVETTSVEVWEVAFWLAVKTRQTTIPMITSSATSTPMRMSLTSDGGRSSVTAAVALISPVTGTPPRLASKITVGPWLGRSVRPSPLPPFFPAKITVGCSATWTI